MARFKSWVALLLAGALSVSGAFSQSLYNSNLTQAQRAELDAGNTVIRSVPSYKKMCMAAANESVRKIMEDVRALNPSYLAEIIQEYPYAGNEDFIRKFEPLVMDVSSYAGIPYYSERHKKWFDLYTYARVNSSSRTSSGTRINATLLMSPFDEFETEIVSERSGEWFRYVSENVGPVYYDGFKCVAPRQMKSAIVVFRSGDKWILYGVGAVKAPTVFFIRNRIETSFMNRIKTFCAFFCEKFQRLP